MIKIINLSNQQFRQGLQLMHQPQQQVQIGFAADWSPSLTICGNATDPASFGVSVISIVGSINRKPEES
jgi:hypothetical protein